jgi:hypothetical protein
MARSLELEEGCGTGAGARHGMSPGSEGRGRGEGVVQWRVGKTARRGRALMGRVLGLTES